MTFDRPSLLDATRSFGGVALATGTAVALVRTPAHDASSFGRTAIVVPIAAILYITSVIAPPARSDPSGSSRAVVAIAAVLASLFATLQLLRWLGADTSSSLWGAVIYATVSLLAGYAAHRTRVAYLALLSALGALLTWAALWKGVAHPSPATNRWLLILAALLLGGAAAALARRSAIGSREVATVAGLAAVLAGIVGVIDSLFQDVGGGLLSPAVPAHRHLGGGETFGWNLYLLIVSVLLVWLGASIRSRGVAYAGALGLVAFVFSVGTQIVELTAGHAPSSGIGGWAIALIVAGGLGLLLPALAQGRPPAD